MNVTDHHARMTDAASSPFAALRRFTQPAPAAERCELCGEQLPAEHQHLIDPESRRLMCACRACALLFTDDGRTKYRSVPRDAWFLSDFKLTDAQWNSLAIPIGLAFFFHSTPMSKVVAIYPSPAGPTESLLELGAWEQIVRDNPVLEKMRPDAQALLVNRVGERREHYLAPIDRCYELVGLIRAHWKGLLGGVEVWEKIERFFTDFARWR